MFFKGTWGMQKFQNSCSKNYEFLLVIKIWPEDILLTKTENSKSATFEAVWAVVSNISRIQHQCTSCPYFESDQVLIRKMNNVVSVGCVNIPSFMLIGLTKHPQYFSLSWNWIWAPQGILQGWTSCPSIRSNSSDTPSSLATICFGSHEHIKVRAILKLQSEKRKEYKIFCTSL